MARYGEKIQKTRKQNYAANKNPEQDITETIEELKAQYDEAAWKRMKVKVGRVLGFNYEGSKTYLEIGRIEDGKYYAKEVELFDPTTVSSHLKHNVDATGEVPYCTDCMVPVSEPSNPAGRAKFEARKERYLSDGTPLDDDSNDNDEE